MRIAMPLRPVIGSIQMPVETEADVHALFEKALSLTSVTGYIARERYLRDIQDHFYYIGAICPQHFRPLQTEVVNLPGEQLSFFSFTFDAWLYLLQDAPDSCVERLMQRLLRPDRDCPPYILEAMLAAIGTPAALAAMAEYAERTQQPKIFRDLGFWLPGQGESAEPRFTRSRRAVRLQPVDPALPLEELAKRPHPVGLPVSFIAEGSTREEITWHYLTLDLTQIEGIPQTPFSRIHLVSPPSNWNWVLFCTLSPQNLYTQAVLHESDAEEPEWIERLREQAHEYQNEGRGEALLLPYDDQLVYRNGHTQLTPDVYGDVGGPPLGLNENPCCPICEKLMFHICTVANTLREYGDGFRSLFICEDCMQVASQAMGWN